MCYFEVDPVRIAKAHQVDYQFEKEIPSLNKLITAGYLELNNGIYKITSGGRPFLRAIATIFDQYFNQDGDIIDRCIHESEG